MSWRPTAACLAVMMGMAASIDCRGEDPRRHNMSQSTATTATIGNTTFVAELAQTAAERARGLSDRHGLSPQMGMLFPLYLIWIGEDCAVVEVTLNVASPASGTPDSQLPLYEPR